MDALSSIHKKCRICLEAGPEFTRRTTDEWENQFTFIDLIQFLTSSTHELIELPEFICGSCESGLVQAFLFKKKCLEAEQILRENQNVPKNNVNLAASSGEEDENCDYRDLLIEPEEPPASPLPEKSTGGTVTHNCLRCKVKFESYRNYQAHYREHHQEKDLCSLCGKFVPRYNLEKHQISHLKPKQRPFVCEECGKCFTLIENLKKHVRIHTGDHRYECEHCQKKFIHWNSKRCHLKTYHTREKDHECNLCKKTFAHRSNLIRHIRYHTGEMPHSCPHCPKKFNTTSELKNHLVTHTKEKNQICDVCSKAFGTRKALNTHLRTHSGERNYICPVCEKGFTQPHVLRTHLKIHHPRHPMPPPGTILSQKRIEVLEKLKESGQQIQSL